MTDSITVERDPRTREIVITGPDGFTASLEDNVIVHQQLLRLQRLLNEVYRAGYREGMHSETAALIVRGEPYDDPFEPKQEPAIPMPAGSK